MAHHRILHISDFHFGNENGGSLLQKEEYRKVFLEKIEELDKNDVIDAVVISGDVADKGGDESLYESAATFVNALKGKLDKAQFICVPGNHDINRNLLLGISGKKGINKEEIWKNYTTKQKYYLKFLKNCGMKNQNNSGLVSFIELKDPNVIILGLDSTDKIGVEDNFGSVDDKSLDSQLKELFADNKYSDYIKIAVMHHTPSLYWSKSQRLEGNNGDRPGQHGTLEPNNCNNLEKILKKYDVRIIMSGHIHGSQSYKLTERGKSYSDSEDGTIYSMCGSLGVDFSVELKNILKQVYEKDENLAKQAKVYLDNLDNLKSLGSLYGNLNSFKIHVVNDESVIWEEDYVYIVDEGECRWFCLNPIPQDKLEECDGKSTFETPIPYDPQAYQDIEIEEKKPDYCGKIMKDVRENELYKTGHYHWKGTYRLNWIDTSFFLKNREKMKFITDGINFKYKNEIESSQCIIGMGIKGAIMLSYIRFIYPDKKCTYLPENDKDFNEYEKSFFMDKEGIREAVILTDVVVSGKTVSGFIKKIKESIGGLSKVKVVTVFKARDMIDIPNDDDNLIISVCSLVDIMINNCSGKGSSCEIYTKKLAHVIEFEEGKR